MFIRNKLPYFLFILAIAFVAILIVATVTHLIARNFSEEVPARGGNITEGIVGYPRLINPILASSPADRDMATLIYSGLFRETVDGQVEALLAKSTETSEDGKQITVTLKEGLTFHDGTPITADDVIFTVETAKNPLLQSTVAALFANVQVTKIGEDTVTFTLTDPDPSFTKRLTIGILPAHIWRGIAIEQFGAVPSNVDPIGSGPFEVERIRRNNQGNVTSYTLSAFDNYVGGRPYLDSIEVAFFDTPQALQNALSAGRVDSADLPLPYHNQDVLDKKELHTAVSTKIFGLFFNVAKEGPFIEKELRQALELSIPREEIITEVTAGYATPLTSPVPGINPVTISTGTPEELFEAAGWTKNEETGLLEDSDGTVLSFTVYTSAVAELEQTAALIESAWEAQGAEVTIQSLPSGELITEIIRPRGFDILLFGQDVQSIEDYAGFWLSSERADPGLNISGYADREVDEVLHSLQQVVAPQEREQLLEKFATLVVEDTPAAFLYAPQLVYATPKNLRGITLPQRISGREERFLTINEWYLYTRSVLSPLRNR